MNRRIVYTAQIPLSADFLQAQKNALQALGHLAQDVLSGSGTKALISGLACTPTTPASMTVDLGPGSVYQRAPIDGAAFGSLPADTTAVLQQGIATATQNLGGFAAPATSGQSINYLVQVQFRQVDSRPLTLPYYNSANPQVPLIGPSGDGSPQSTDRSGTVAVQVLAGAAAATGTQTTPSPSDGWIPAYVVTVAFGQTTLGTGNIAVHSDAPFLASLTSQHHLGLPGTAPKIVLGLETQGTLPDGQIPDSVARDSDVTAAVATAAADATSKANAAETNAKGYTDGFVNRRARAWARVLGNGTFSGQQGFAGVQRVGTGVYRLQLANPPAENVPVAVIASPELQSDVIMFHVLQAQWDDSTYDPEGAPQRITVHSWFFQATGTYTTPLRLDGDFNLVVFW